jgi:hypothetical protein
LLVGGRELAYNSGPAPVRANRKILVAAGLAAKRGDVEKAPKERKRRGHVVGGDTLQFRIAATGTTGEERLAEGQGAGMESRLAPGATPWINPEEAEEVIHSGVAARAPHVLMFANRAVHRGAGNLSI